MKQKTFEVSEEVEKFAKEVMQKDSTKIAADCSELNITYLKQYPIISKTAIATCTKPGKLLKHFSKSDIIIQVAGDVWDKLTDEVKYRIILHELMHIFIKYTKNGNIIVGLRQHNCQDFREIISEYGIDWAESASVILDSLNEKE